MTDRPSPDQEREAIARLERYVQMRAEKPLKKLDDMVHGIHCGTEWEAELRLTDLAVILSRIQSLGSAPVTFGPQPVDRVTCEGCSAFKSEWWKDHLDNDETDSGTSATCTAADKHITSYWSPKGAPPSWCPALAPPTTNEGDRS